MPGLIADTGIVSLDAGAEVARLPARGGPATARAHAIAPNNAAGTNKAATYLCPLRGESARAMSGERLLHGPDDVVAGPVVVDRAIAVGVAQRSIGLQRFRIDEQHARHVGAVGPELLALRHLILVDVHHHELVAELLQRRIVELRLERLALRAPARVHDHHQRIAVVLRFLQAFVEAAPRDAFTEAVARRGRSLAGAGLGALGLGAIVCVAAVRAVDAGGTQQQRRQGEGPTN